MLCHRCPTSNQRWANVSCLLDMNSIALWHRTLGQCCFTAGPTSDALTHHWKSLGVVPRVNTHGDHIHGLAISSGLWPFCTGRRAGNPVLILYTASLSEPAGPIRYSWPFTPGFHRIRWNGYGVYSTFLCEQEYIITIFLIRDIYTWLIPRSQWPVLENVVLTIF